MQEICLEDGVEYCIEVLDIVQMIVRGDPAETSSKIGHFGGGFPPDYAHDLWSHDL
jgi:hypothetical protein